MSVVKSFDDKSVYEDVLPHAVFEAAQYVDTDIAKSVPKCVRGKIYPGSNNPGLRKVFQHGYTHADLSTMPKVRINSIYGEFHNKENSPEA